MFFINRLVNRINYQKEELLPLLRLTSVFVFVFFTYLIANIILIRYLSVRDIKSTLVENAISLANDFEYINNTWNTDKYLSDINSYSEGPVYIFSLDGFLIDRMSIIHGFLDTSSFEYASSFLTPKTIVSPINEKWRAYSYPINRNNQTYGVILLAYFDPRGVSEKELDELLTTTAKTLDRQIQIIEGVIDISLIQQNEIDPNILLEIIDPYNRDLLSKGGPPAYIDKSYIQDVMSGDNFQTIQDKKTKSKFLMRKQLIISEEKPVGIVIIGKGLDEMNRILGYQIILSCIVGLVSIAGFLIVTLYVYKHDIAKIIKDKMLLISSPQVNIESISFNTNNSQLIFNGTHTVDLPSDTYQDEICKLLFKSPNKKFDTLDIIDLLSETADDPAKNKRLVYDAIEAINSKVKKKVGHLLVEHKNKEYFMSPVMASKIKRLVTQT